MSFGIWVCHVALTKCYTHPLLQVWEKLLISFGKLAWWHFSWSFATFAFCWLFFLLKQQKISNKPKSHWYHVLSRFSWTDFFQYCSLRNEKESWNFNICNFELKIWNCHWEGLKYYFWHKIVDYLEEERLGRFSQLLSSTLWFFFYFRLV